jgi:septal ring factor EnvC (AmiA/AmiB activator)
MKKIWKYVIAFFTFAGGILVAFLSGKDSGRSQEKRKGIDKKLKEVKSNLKDLEKKKNGVKKTLKSKKKALEEIKKQKEKKVKKKSAKKAHSRLKNIGKGKK